MSKVRMIALAGLVVSLPAVAQVSFERLLNAASEPENWLNYSATYDNQRYSRLDQVNRDNVGELELQWIWQAASLEKFEATPLVVDGVLYTVQAPNDVVAMDAATGRVFWRYHHENAPEARGCCGRVNRGLAISGETLFMGSFDAQLLALDAITGQLLWQRQVADPDDFYSITMSPLVVDDKVMIGTGGGDGGARGIVDAYHVETGERLWRFNTVPGPGEPGNETWSGDSWREGGSGVWNHGAYDPETGLVFFGVGNPAPPWDGSVRIGDNLYSNSVVALDVATGKLQWHYQFTPHDELDYDSTQVPLLADMNWRGEPRKLMLWANRNGLLYALDRVTGEFLAGKPFVSVNWMDGFDENGRPNQFRFPTPEGTEFRPHVHGGTNWAPPSWSPRTELYYVSHWEDSAIIAIEGEFPRSAGENTRQTAMGAVDQQPLFNNNDEAHGVVRAYDPETLDTVWEFRMADITWAGTLATAGDLVFGGGREGYFFALDAESGELLWKQSVGGQVNAGPMSFAVDGRQYIAVAAGNALFTFALP